MANLEQSLNSLTVKGKDMEVFYPNLDPDSNSDKYAPHPQIVNPTLTVESKWALTCVNTDVHTHLICLLANPDPTLTVARILEVQVCQVKINRTISRNATVTIPVPLLLSLAMQI